MLKITTYQGTGSDRKTRAELVNANKVISCHISPLRRNDGHTAYRIVMMFEGQPPAQDDRINNFRIVGYFDRDDAEAKINELGEYRQSLITEAGLPYEEREHHFEVNDDEFEALIKRAERELFDWSALGISGIAKRLAEDALIELGERIDREQNKALARIENALIELGNRINPEY